MGQEPCCNVERGQSKASLNNMLQRATADLNGSQNTEHSIPFVFVVAGRLPTQRNAQGQVQD